LAGCRGPFCFAADGLNPRGGGGGGGGGGGTLKTVGVGTYSKTPVFERVSGGAGPVFLSFFRGPRFFARFSQTGPLSGGGRSPTGPGIPPPRPARGRPAHQGGGDRSAGGQRKKPSVQSVLVSFWGAPRKGPGGTSLFPGGAGGADFFPRPPLGNFPPNRRGEIDLLINGFLRAKKKVRGSPGGGGGAGAAGFEGGPARFSPPSFSNPFRGGAPVRHLGGGGARRGGGPRVLRAGEGKFPSGGHWGHREGGRHEGLGPFFTMWGDPPPVFHFPSGKKRWGTGKGSEKGGGESRRR